MLNFLVYSYFIIFVAMYGFFNARFLKKFNTSDRIGSITASSMWPAALILFLIGEPSIIKDGWRPENPFKYGWRL